MRSSGGQRPSWNHFPRGVHSDQAQGRRNEPGRSDFTGDCVQSKRRIEGGVFTDRRCDRNCAALPRVAELRGDFPTNYRPRDHGKSASDSPSSMWPNRQSQLSDSSANNPTRPSLRRHESSPEAFHARETIAPAEAEHGFHTSPRRFTSEHFPSDNQVYHDSPWSPSSLASRQDNSSDQLDGWERLRIDSPGIKSPTNSSGVESPQSRRAHRVSSSSSPLAQSTTTSPLRSTSVTKKSRYLREMDRRDILSRLAKGEKQVVLAKEYGVSRSTICNLFKQRDVVLARLHENPLCRHPKKSRLSTAVTASTPAPALDTQMRVDASLSAAIGSPQTDLWGHATGRYCEPTAGPPRASSASTNVLIQVQSRAIALLQTKVHDRETSDDDFGRSSARLMRLLLEEAIGSVAARCTPPSPRRGYNSNPPLVDTMCAITMSESGTSLLNVFRRLEPEVPTGFIGESLTSPSELELYTISDLSHLGGQEVLLLDIVVASGDDACSAIDLLRARGVADNRITIVALFVAAEAVALVQQLRPRVRILTTGVDAQLGHRSRPTYGATTTSSSSSRIFLERFRTIAW